MLYAYILSICGMHVLQTTMTVQLNKIDNINWGTPISTEEKVETVGAIQGYSMEFLKKRLSSAGTGVIYKVLKEGLEQ